MAIVNVTIKFWYEPSLGISATNPRITVSPSVTLYAGDELRFTVTGDLGARDNIWAFNLYGFHTDVWVNADAINVAAWDTTYSKVVKANTIVGYNQGITSDLWIGDTPNGRTSPPSSIYISAAQDLIPEQFDLGPDLVGLQPADTFVAALVVVSGINSSVPVSISTTGGGSAYFTINNGLAQTSSTCTNGQKIQVFGTCSSLYGSGTTVTLNIGGVTDSITATTTSTPPTESLIPFPRTNYPITLQEVKNFFGGALMSVPAPENLRAYMRGGSYVPDISQNAVSVPSSGNIALGNLLGSYTTLYFTKFPKSILKSAVTSSSSASLNQTWSIRLNPTDTSDDKFDIGYGSGMRGAVEYSYSLSQDTGGNKSTGVILVVESGQPETYNAGNTYVTVQSPVVSQGAEARYSGTITINIKSKYSPYPVRTATCKYFFNFYSS